MAQLPVSVPLITISGRKLQINPRFVALIHTISYPFDTRIVH